MVNNILMLENVNNSVITMFTKEELIAIKNLVDFACNHVSVADEPLLLDIIEKLEKLTKEE